jgi:hypothetical protein
MTAPVRLQLSRRKGFDLQALSQATNGLPVVKVSRPGKWGNPFNLRAREHCWTAIVHGFKANRLGRQAASVKMFLTWVLNGKPDESSDCGLYAEVGGKSVPLSTSPAIKAGQPPTREAIRAELAGKNLACWCKPGEPCHADVLLALANGEGER